MGTRRKERLVNGVWVDDSTIVSAADETPKADIRADGSLRRAGPGRRSIMEYFSAEDKRREVLRSELLGVLEAVEYARVQNRWYRQVWRWLRGSFTYSLTFPFVHVEPYPGQVDLPVLMAKGHERRTIKPMLESVQAELDRRARAKREEEEKGRAGGDR